MRAFLCYDKTFCGIIFCGGSLLKSHCGRVLFNCRLRRVTFGAAHRIWPKVQKVLARDSVITAVSPGKGFNETTSVMEGERARVCACVHTHTFQDELHYRNPFLVAFYIQCGGCFRVSVGSRDNVRETFLFECIYIYYIYVCVYILRVCEHLGMVGKVACCLALWNRTKRPIH